MNTDSPSAAEQQPKETSPSHPQISQMKDPKATVAARGPWVPLVVEAVVPTAYRQALGTRASTNLNLPQLASRRCAVRAPRLECDLSLVAAMSPSPGRVAYGGGDAAATERRLRSAIRRERQRRHSPSRPPVSSMAFVVQNPRRKTKTRFPQIVLQMNFCESVKICAICG